MLSASRISFTHFATIVLLVVILLWGWPGTGAGESASMAPRMWDAGSAAETLLHYQIITAADMARSDHITNREALEILHKIIGNGHSSSLKEWYAGSLLEPLDGLDEEYKRLLSSLREKFIVKPEEFFELAPDDYFTQCTALGRVYEIS